VSLAEILLICIHNPSFIPVRNIALYSRDLGSGTGFTRPFLQKQFLSYALIIQKSTFFAKKLTMNYRKVSERFITKRLSGLDRLISVRDPYQKKVGTKDVKQLIDID